MTTAIEEPKTEVLEQSRRQTAVGSFKPVRPQAAGAREYKALFSDSLLDEGGAEKRRKAFSASFSFILQCFFLGILLLIPLMFTEALPKGQLLTFLVAPPPPPPPPPPPAAPAVRVVRETNMLNNGALRTPTRIPQKVEIVKEEEAPPPMAGGVVVGVPGGIPGGQLGGVIGGIISSSSAVAAVPKLAVKRVRVSQGVTQGLLVHKVEPAYPKIALAARITGVVELRAIISKDGTIKQLEVEAGSPLLVPAAINAVKQWRYRPYLLNGEAVEVETSVTVTFQISS